MKRSVRRRWIGMLSLGLIAVATIVVALLAPWQSYSTGTVFAGTNGTSFTATGYSDVIRFQAEGVATLQVRIFDLSGKVVWDSSVVSGDTIDWNRNNDFGERLAYGAYIYSAQGWNAQGDLNFQKNGKLALMPGDKVQLQSAPVPTPASPFNPLEDRSLTVQPKGLSDVGVFKQVGIGTDTPTQKLTVASGAIEATASGSAWGTFILKQTSGKDWRMQSRNTGEFVFRNNTDSVNVMALVGSNVGIGTTSPTQKLSVANGAIEAVSDGTAWGTFILRQASGKDWRMQSRNTGEFVFRNSTDSVNVMALVGSKVGIGTTDPAAKLTVQATSGDLIAAYNSSNRVFVVKNTGEVRADGAYYSGAGGCGTGGFIADGGADVAERINTSEWVEPGNVVEIDPEHSGFFRKSSSPYSTKVAGIISTSPGVILGNSFDAATDDWEDNRPVLAVTGRVPCKVSAENGPIQIGDLLVASSTPGIAMKGNPERAMGAVVGKAMEPLENGEGTIVVQVMLR